MPENMFHTIVPYAAGVDSIAASLDKFVDDFHIITYSFVLVLLSYLLMSVYDRCCWNRSGNVLVSTEFFLDLIPTEFFRFHLGKKKFMINTTNPRSEFNVLTVEVQ